MGEVVPIDYLTPVPEVGAPAFFIALYGIFFIVAVYDAIRFRGNVVTLWGLLYVAERLVAFALYLSIAKSETVDATGDLLIATQVLLSLGFILLVHVTREMVDVWYKSVFIARDVPMPPLHDHARKLARLLIMAAIILMIIGTTDVINGSSVSTGNTLRWIAAAFLATVLLIMIGGPAAITLGWMPNAVLPQKWKNNEQASAAIASISTTNRLKGHIMVFAVFCLLFRVAVLFSYLGITILGDKGGFATDAELYGLEIGSEVCAYVTLCNPFSMHLFYGSTIAKPNAASIPTADLNGSASADTPAIVIA